MKCTISENLIEAINKNPTFEIQASLDLSYDADETTKEVRAFGSDLCDFSVSESREEITVVFGTGDLNYSISELLKEKLTKVISDNICSSLNSKGDISGTKRFEKALTKNILALLDKPFSQ
jgi:hypothetical protein